MTSALVVAGDHWEDEGRRAAGALRDVACAVIVGLDAEQSARVALGIARAEGARRPVAVGDLTGLAMPLYDVAGGEDALGLTDCFRDGLSLNDVARPSPTSDSLFVLPAGTPPVATEALFTHERWPRLINGFGKAGALLLLIAPIGAPGLEVLVGHTGGVIAVDVAPNRVRAFTVLAMIDPPALEPLRTLAPPPRGVRGGWSRRRLWLTAAALVAVAGLGGSLAWERTRARAAPKAPAPPKSTAADTTRPVLVVPKADTIQLRDPAEAADTLLSAAYAVNLVAANTFSGANSVLRDGEKQTMLPAATVAPVTLGGGTLWYQVIVGAYQSRSDAEALLVLLRSHKLVREDGGVVVRVPYAVLLSDHVPALDAHREIDAWRSKGIEAYALMQVDGNVRVLAGAFETPAQAAPLAAQLRRAGAQPTIAYRNGRVF